MAFRLSVCYGTPDDPETFDAYYEDVHIPLANKVPGLNAFTWGKARSIDGSEPPFYAVANLYFTDATALGAAMKSPQMQAAAQDVANFATGGVTMFTQEEKVVGTQR